MTDIIPGVVQITVACRPIFYGIKMYFVIIPLSYGGNTCITISVLTTTLIRSYPMSSKLENHFDDYNCFKELRLDIFDAAKKYKKVENVNK